MQLSRMAASSGPFGANSKKGFMGEDEGKILMNKIPKGLVNIREVQEARGEQPGAVPPLVPAEECGLPEP